MFPKELMHDIVYLHACVSYHGTGFLLENITRGGKTQPFESGDD